MDIMYGVKLNYDTLYSILEKNGIEKPKIIPSNNIWYTGGCDGNIDRNKVVVEKLKKLFTPVEKFNPEYYFYDGYVIIGKNLEGYETTYNDSYDFQNHAYKE